MQSDNIKTVISLIFHYVMLVFWRGLTSTLVFQFLILVLFNALIYVMDDHAGKMNFFLAFGFWKFVWFALNVAVIYTITIILFRGLISPLIFMITMVLYAAGMKYLTGSLLPGLEIKEIGSTIPIAIYMYFMTYFDGLMRGEIQTAIVYRTTNDD